MKIKSVILLLAFFIVFAGAAFSQANFSKGTHTINLGAGFGNRYYTSLGGGAGYNFHSYPALTLSIDHGFQKMPQIRGTLGIGVLIGYQTSTVNYTDEANYYNQRWNNLIIAPRLTYHAGFLNSAKIDLYGGVMVGMRIENYRFSSNNSAYTSLYSGTYGGQILTGGVFIGGIYYFVKNIGAFAELGYDVSYIKVGISLKTGVRKR